jgi:phenylalanyl-tRNA synthetase beta chain
LKAPLSWLEEYVRPGLDAAALAERLALTGTDVERITRHGVGELDFFVVGRVLGVASHPDADRLRVCRVAVGEGDVAQIVCGAPNVAEGQTVAVARPGAVMPDGTRLKKAKLRGVASEGMILAEDELAIGTDHAGILVLDETSGLRPPWRAAPEPADGDGPGPGTPLSEVLTLATDVLELEITPNRPDCLGIYGVAREVAAATGAPLAPAPWSDDLGTPGEPAGAEVVVEVPDLCSRFTARVFEGVAIGPSPPWLKARLMAAGQRPISNVVDITNYVMLLTGQPLHAFDLDRVAGRRLVVRRARDGEPVQTLDGQTRKLDADMVLIADDDGPTSIAGVMGGARSEVDDGTTRVLMEVATWDGPNIKRTSEKLGLRSEASGRYEKGLQPEQALWAQAVAATLMVELCGASVRPGTIDVGGGGPPAQEIRLREARVGRLLGRAIPRARQAEILASLEFGVREADDGLDVAVPAFRRADITREVDLIEEVARIDGLEQLPATISIGPQAALTARQRLRRRAADALAGRGLHEAVGWSLTDPAVADRLRLAPGDERRRFVELVNPLSSELGVLRTTLVGSLLDAAARNVARDAGPVRLFEQGTVYRDLGDRLPRERQHLAALLLGPARPPSWREPRPPAGDLFAAKALVDALLGELRAPVEYARAEERFLHPGRSAEIRVGGTAIGWVGEIHPLVAATWELPVAAGFELDLDAVPEPPVAAFRPIPGFPAVRQDLAVVVSDDVTAARLLELTRRASRLLERVEVFDVYRGAQVGEGRTSLALHLVFRAPDRTLTEEEASAERTRIVDALRAEVGAEPRG